MRGPRGTLVPGNKDRPSVSEEAALRHSVSCFGGSGPARCLECHAWARFLERWGFLCGASRWGWVSAACVTLPQGVAVGGAGVRVPALAFAVGTGPGTPPNLSCFVETITGCSSEGNCSNQTRQKRRTIINHDRPYQGH